LVKWALLSGTSSSTNPPLPVPWQISAFVTSALAAGTTAPTSAHTHTAANFFTAVPQSFG
jgi:hypothetical protein